VRKKSKRNGMKINVIGRREIE